MDIKIKAFAGLPNSELTQVSEPVKEKDEAPPPRSVAEEFNETKQHTQTVQDTPKTEGATLPGAASTTDSATTPKKNRLGKVMSGDFAVNMVDMLLPGILVLLIGKIGYAIDKKDLQLSAKEKEALSPAVQDCLDDINLDFSNPWVNLSVMIAIVYGAKVIDKMPSMKKREAPKEKESVAETINKVVNGSGENGEPVSDMDKFEADYFELCESVRKKMKKGMPAAKEYVAINYSDKIKTLARKHGIDLKRIHHFLGFRAPKKEQDNGFNLP